MKYLFPLLLSFMFLFSCNQKNGLGTAQKEPATTTKPNTVPKENINTALFQAWKHSHEENFDGNQVYRLASHKFPPSRGRFGFQLHKDGTANIGAIARGDGTDYQKGRWTLEDKILTISFNTADRDDRKYEVITIARDKLILKMLGS